MFKEFLFPLVKYFTPFNVFQYITFRAAYAAVTALLLSFLMGPWVIRQLRILKAAQAIREDGPETHLVKSGTPTMGGVMILFAIVVSVLLWQDLRNMYTWIMLIAVVGFGAVGFADDILKVTRKNSQGLPARGKLFGQIFVASLIAVLLYLYKTPYTTLLYLPMLKEAVLDMGVLWIPFAILLQVGFSNAVNLADGLDGLATGLVIMVGTAFAALCYLSGRADYAAYLQIPNLPGAGELAVLCLAYVGASVGFLWYNTHPAEVMMGDVGSLSLGGVLGVLSLLVKKELLLLIIGGVFVVEAASVMIQVAYFKVTKGRRVFLMAPLHHHFEKKGWTEVKVVVRFWILGGLFLILGLSTLKIQ
ncbi:MAG: phospho-N-acetylmuramoyl-pentapeptide-transferase [Spirochaetales bacterium]|jgi:phospho-N-acetylmuramoyl-pentapeptide-transferase|nr:phospho-N-acetylmuramoyl-pentapeptide-transferase [Spirochaetales bacterium]